MSTLQEIKTAIAGLNEHDKTLLAAELFAAQAVPFHDLARGIRKMSLPPYLIFYVCDERAGTVSIIHFWHGARRSPYFFAAS